MFHSDLAKAFTRLLRLEQALEHLNEAVSLSPTNPTTRLNRARLYLKMGYSDLASTDFRYVSRLSPQTAKSLNQNGISLAHRGKTREAVEQFLIAHSIDPGDISITQNLANAYSEEGEEQKA